MIPNVVSNLNQYPATELTLDRSHRIRSWTLQSVGQEVYDAAIGRLATVLLLQGEKLDGTWAILDIALTPNNFYNNSTKTRIDKVVDHKELVRKIRLSAIAATHSIPNRWQALLAGISTMATFCKMMLRLTVKSDVLAQQARRPGSR